MIARLSFSRRGTAAAVSFPSLVLICLFIVGPSIPDIT